MSRLSLCAAILVLIGGAAAEASGQGLPGLVGHWSAEKNAQDVSGNGNDGTLVGGAKFAPGIVGEAFQFQGGSHVSIPNDVSLNLSSFTLSAWIKPSASTSGFQTVIAKSGGVFGTETRNYGLFVNGGEFTTGTVHASLAVAPARFVGAQGKTKVTNGVFHHVAATFDPAIGFKIYIDGNDETTALPSLGLGIGAKPFLIDSPVNIGYNRIATPYAPMNGAVDEVQIYNRALSAGEVKLLAFAPEPCGVLLLGAGFMIFVVGNRKRRSRLF